MGAERRYAYRILVERPEGRRPHGRYKRGWEYTIKMDLQECGDDPSGFVQCREFLGWLRNYQLMRNDSAVWS